MTRFSILLAALALATPAIAHPLEGLWRKGSMTIRIAPCGAAMCGTVVKASDSQQRKAMNGSGTHLIGATLIRGIVPAGDGSWRAKVFAADRNINASGSIRQPSPDMLQVQGCAFLFLCRTQTWVRVR
ncbi:DUF2147 domain-containing protein [Sphingomonas sp. ASV193]|uniref:DUF2147 domain-containing protein n=1 Tax=Sphingomonas sp. ASV193 TaxID=3144405 RepID=UPI0032E90CA3